MNVVLLGCGAVGSALIECWDRFMSGAGLGRVLVIDACDCRAKVPRHMAFVQAELAPHNYAEVLSQHLVVDDLLVDLSVGIDSSTLIAWCQAHRVVYVNSSFELWRGGSLHWSGADSDAVSLEARHRTVRELAASKPAATAVVLHGMNPGLVSHFAKEALRRLAQGTALETRSSAEIARALGCRVVHVSERDSQIVTREAAKQPAEFVNTWSCAGIFEEASEPVQIAWGTHEGPPPVGAALREHMVVFSTKAADFKMRSFVPRFGAFSGYVMPHSECLTIQRHLTVSDAEGRPVYRPTVAFVYAPSSVAEASLAELRAERGWQLRGRQRVLARTEVESGADTVGVLLLLDDRQFWAGSILSVQQVASAAPETTANATVMQVVVGVATATRWAAAHPREGLCFPEDLPSEEILREAAPFLGDVVFEAVAWSEGAGSRELVDFGT